VDFSSIETFYSKRQSQGATESKIIEKNVREFKMYLTL